MTLDLHRRNEAELKASLAATLERKVGLTADGVWVFVYGLLLFDPPFEFAKQKQLTLKGWHRAFNLADPMNRGTPEASGLTLGLAQGGECKGMAFLLPGDKALEGLEKIWQQEMVLPFYTPAWQQIERQETLVMMTDPSSPALRQLSDDELIETVATAQGSAGTNRDYLRDVRTGLMKHRMIDPYLEGLAQRVWA